MPLSNGYRVLLTVLLLLVGGVVYGANGYPLTFSFKIVDKGTLIPIRTAKVYAKGKSGERTAQPDFVGNPSLDIEPGKYIIRVEAEGYRSVDTIINLVQDKRTVVILLSKQTVEDSNVDFSVSEKGNVISLNIEDARKPEIEEEEPDTLQDSLPVRYSKFEEVQFIQKLKSEPATTPIESEPVYIDRVNLKSLREPEPPVLAFDPGMKEIPVSETVAKKEDNSVMATKKEESFFEEDSVAAQELNTDQYLPNNIIFLIDCSGSMAESDKILLVKKSIIKLLGFLRPNDKVSAIAYNTIAQTVFSGVNGDDKKVVESGLRRLNPNGGTNASDGLVVAYELARKQYIEGGNNLIIFITDGDVNSTSKTKAMISEGLQSGIRLSVLGIKNELNTERSMRNISALGGGDYLSMRGKKVDQVLLDEIKDKSLIRK